MAVDIGPRIGIDGEKQFRKELSDINQQLRTLGSEMKAVTSSFDDNADQQEVTAEKTRVLTKQIETQQKKLDKLREGLKKSADKYGDADSKTQRWKQAVHDATTELNNMERELEDVNSDLDDMGDTVAPGGPLGNFGDMMIKGLAVGAVVGAVTQITDALFDVTDKAIEYNRVMGALETSSANAGYTAEETEEAYKRLYGVLGDQQSAATTVANLQAIGLSQEDLMAMIDLTTGAWAKYGDSIPIDGLAESINETIKTGEVTGNLSDVLNWAGIKEEYFAQKMEDAKTSSERAQTVMDILAKEGLYDVAEGFRVAEEKTIKANEAQADYDKAVANLGEKLLPARTALVEFATGAWDVLAGSIQTVIDLYNDAIELFNKEKALREKHGFFIDEKDRMAAYGWEAYENEEGLTRYRKADSSAITSPGTSASGVGDIYVNVTSEVGGVAVAQQQYKYNASEQERRGPTIVRNGR